MAPDQAQGKGEVETAPFQSSVPAAEAPPAVAAASPATTGARQESDTQPKAASGKVLDIPPYLLPTNLPPLQPSASPPLQPSHYPFKKEATVSTPSGEAGTQGRGGKGIGGGEGGDVPRKGQEKAAGANRGGEGIEGAGVSGWSKKGKTREPASTQASTAAPAPASTPEQDQLPLPSTASDAPAAAGGGSAKRTATPAMQFGLFGAAMRDIKKVRKKKEGEHG